MKKFTFSFLLLIMMGLFVISCGNKETQSNTTEENTEEAAETKTENTADAEAAEGDNDESGPEFTSAYVCPMHCAGSGGAEAGKCPACGMDYVENEDHKEGAHEHGEEGHDHGDGHSHDGHDHDHG